MAKVRLIIRPWLSNVMGSDGSGPITLYEGISGNATVGRVLRGIATKNKAFGEAVFDVKTDGLSGHITIALKNHLLGEARDLDLPVEDGDTISLFPTIEGG